MKKIVAATSNEGKLKEIREILNEYEIISLKDINCEIEVEEDGKTFEENALKKAREIYKATKTPCIADDSGLCIEEYKGWPGVETARFLGKNKATNEYARERNEYILKKMKNLPKQKRKAKHVTCISYVDSENEYITIGEQPGYIAESPRGNNGFGFDEIFELENGKTMAEIPKDEKNKISSRKIALEKMRCTIYR